MDSPERKAKHATSKEEVDHLTRSTKKIKGQIYENTSQPPELTQPPVSEA